jgi:cysteinyl-tRNA synthetase
VKNKFIAAMDNDFNTSLAISYVFDYLAQLSQMIGKKDRIQDMVDFKAAIVDVYSVLELFQKDPQPVLEDIRNKYLNINGITEETILDLIEKRKVAKESKDYATADEIRNQLTSKGILIKDTSAGTEWDIGISPKK